MISELLMMLSQTSSTMKIVMLIIWTIVIVLTIVIEAETAELVSCWFSVGAFISLILALFGIDIYIQIIIFAISSALLVAITRPIMKKFTKKEEIPTNADRVIGMVALVTKEISSLEKGEVKVNYQHWTAINKKGKSFKENDKVVVVDIDGNKLIVDSIEDIDIK